MASNFFLFASFLFLSAHPLHLFSPIPYYFLNVFQNSPKADSLFDRHRLLHIHFWHLLAGALLFIFFFCCCFFLLKKKNSNRTMNFVINLQNLELLLNCSALLDCHYHVTYTPSSFGPFFSSLSNQGQTITLTRQTNWPHCCRSVSRYSPLRVMYTSTQLS